ncbi:MAG TPA: SDR family NAD(P)-dependent oxidoreductase [Allosphingosinicella sp.]
MQPEHQIVIAGAACRFPDANDPGALFSNSLAGRQSFRPMPPSRLPLDLYSKERAGEADSITRVPAGLLTDWRFDPTRFRIPRKTFLATDLTHWLALEVAADAVEAAGGADVLDRERTAVVVANTLTGEFSRNSILRLRWPWLDEQLVEVLTAAGLDERTIAWIRSAFRDRLREALPQPNEESLAGGLSNTIAGRIANQLDLHGGAWCVDAACASSLVALAAAANLISAGTVEAAIVAAVDLSLDPFELVGFSRVNALAPNRMRVFDARAEGFWPGEGAGALILMGREAARRRGLDPGVSLAGWGVSTDGKGGLTRPDARGQGRALERAYRAAGIDPAALGYVEAHGTGTSVGDPIEISALAAFLGKGGDRPVPVGSIKGNIGHTKAAAGLAGLIRTAEALRSGVVPPHAGCEQPHPIFAETGHRLRVATAEEWRPGPRVAGVSSFGFGGINAHAVLVGPDGPSARARPPQPPARNGDLFLFRGRDAADLMPRLKALVDRAATMSFAEMGDAAAWASRAVGEGALRLAFVAADPGELSVRGKAALSALEGGDLQPGVHLGKPDSTPRIGLVFPGQAAPTRTQAGAWARRFPGRYPAWNGGADSTRTEEAQPLIVRACLGGLDLLEGMGIRAAAAIGHSLGELAALAWAGVLPRDALVSLAAARGRAMGQVPPGAMLQLTCSAVDARALIEGLDAQIACFNGASETVLSGSFQSIDVAQQRAQTCGIRSHRLVVSHAFHAPTMAAAGPALSEALSGATLRPASRPVVSTVTGHWIAPDTDIRSMLVRQLCDPVRFAEAAAKLAESVDVLVETGPGTGMRRLLLPYGIPVVSLDVFGDSLEPALSAAASLFVLGHDIDVSLLCEPASRPFSIEEPSLLDSPCGRSARETQPLAPAETAVTEAEPQPPLPAGGDTLSLLIALVSRETKTPISAIEPHHRFLDDLGFSSLEVPSLIDRLAELLDRRPPGYRTAFSNASLQEVATAFVEAEAVPVEAPPARVEGVAPWLRRFAIVAAPLSVRGEKNIDWRHTTRADADPGSGDGLAIHIAEWQAERDAWPLVRLCQRAVGNYRHLALCHSGAPLSGFGRSLAAERHFESVRVIPDAAAAVLLRRQIVGFEEIVRKEDGSFATPVLRPLAPVASENIEVGTIVVTGGARGIGTECAIDLALRTGSPLVLVGRSAPDVAALSAIKARVSAVGVEVRYVQADVCDAPLLRRGIADAVAGLSPVTHLIHAAGLNEPALLGALDEAAVASTLSPKCSGLLAAIDACGGSLKRVVAFSSIIGRLGLAGETHYALANAEQSRLLAAVAAERPGLSGLSVEWSVWAGVGMGERLGAAERLAAAGVDALRLSEAVAESTTLCLSGAEGSMVVASRFACNETVAFEEPLRFIDRALVYTPEVEIVAETSIGPGHDRYLADHMVGGASLVPGVILLEAMAQAASALVPECGLSLADIAFERAVQIGSSDLTVRIGALGELDGTVRAEVRSGSDDYRERHARAAFVGGTQRPPSPPPAVGQTFDAAPLYGPLFFQGPAFRRVARLGVVSSRLVEAFLAPAAPDACWFSSYQSQTLLLGDPGARDAALHVLQCCIPHRRLIPTSARRLDRFGGGPAFRVRAVELWCNGAEYAFDILIMDGDDQVVEQWSEVVFRDVGAIDVAPVIAAAPALRAAFLERRAREETGDDSLQLVLVEDSDRDRQERRTRAAAALGIASPLGRRGDGAPIHPDERRGLSFAHCDAITVGVSAAGPVSCDVERIAAFAAGQAGDVWVAEETLRKLGNAAPLREHGPGRFAGDRAERIAILGQVESQQAGPVLVAVGTGPKA